MGFMDTVVGNTKKASFNIDPDRPFREALFGKASDNEVPKEAAGTSFDPRSRNLTTNAVALAGDFEKNLPGKKYAYQQLAESMARRSAQASDQNVNRKANQRGLLYSGLKEAEQANQRSGIASGLAQDIVSFNKNQEDASRDMAGRALAMRLGLESDIQADLSAVEDFANKQDQKNSGFNLGTLGKFSDKLTNW